MGEHPHGNPNRYRHGGCRCTPCRDANTRHMTRYRMRVSSGSHQPDVDADPVRQHVQRLRDSGLGTARVAELAGVGHETVRALLAGRPSVGLPPTKKMRPATAAKILAVRYGQLPQEGWVPGVGTRRRLRALSAMGWPLTLLEDRLGVARTCVQRMTAASGARVSAARARAVAELYDELWKLDPLAAGVSGQVVTRLRRAAVRKGWLSPLAWDDDVIDLPDDELEAELRRRVALMDVEELQRCHNARFRGGDNSPLMVEAAREYKRRPKGTRRDLGEVS